jgi:enoyl-CoA hydratase/carnithine racemase
MMWAGGTMQLSEYTNKYENFRFDRRDGILEITLHTDGGPFVLSETAHHDFSRVFQDVADDRENRVVILTGTGDRFRAHMDYGSFLERMLVDNNGAMSKIRSDGTRMLQAFLGIEVPVIAAINGPVHSHSELPLIADIVLATESTTFRDATHVPVGNIPGDGMTVVWTELLGLNRGKYFLLTGEVLSARDALASGGIGEIVPQSRLLERAWEIAADLARLTPLVLRSIRGVVTLRWKRLFLEELEHGFLFEECGWASLPAPNAGAGTVDLLEM